MESNLHVLRRSRILLTTPPPKYRCTSVLYIDAYAYVHFIQADNIELTPFSPHVRSNQFYPRHGVSGSSVRLQMPFQALGFYIFTCTRQRARIIIHNLKVATEKPRVQKPPFFSSFCYYFPLLLPSFRCSVPGFLSPYEVFPGKSIRDFGSRRARCCMVLSLPPPPPGGLRGTHSCRPPERCSHYCPGPPPGGAVYCVFVFKVAASFLPTQV